MDVSDRIAGGRLIVLTAREAAWLAAARAATVEWLRARLVTDGLRVPRELLDLFDALEATAAAGGMVTTSDPASDPASDPFRIVARPAESDQPRWMSTADAARRLGIGSRGVLKAEEAGHLVGRQLGDAHSAWSWSVESVEAYALKRRRRGRTAS